MNGLINWWTRNTVAANLLMFGIFVAGIIGFTSMEREMDPHVRFPGISIEVSWPGASPVEVEEQIIARYKDVIAESGGVESAPIRQLGVESEADATTPEATSEDLPTQSPEDRAEEDGSAWP